VPQLENDRLIRKGLMISVTPLVAQLRWMVTLLPVTAKGAALNQALKFEDIAPGPWTGLRRNFGASDP
jgi:hypothetical protein